MDVVKFSNRCDRVQSGLAWYGKVGRVRQDKVQYCTSLVQFGMVRTARY